MTIRSWDTSLIGVDPSDHARSVTVSVLVRSDVTGSVDGRLAAVLLRAHAWPPALRLSAT